MAKKPFAGYNPKKHSKSGGLSDSYREKYNKEHGSNLKRPQPEGGSRKESFCARMSGVKGPLYKYVDTDRDGDKEKIKTAKKAALDRWKCRIK